MERPPLRLLWPLEHAVPVVGILLGPFTGALDRTVLIVLPVICNGLIQGIVDVWCGHERLDREQDGLDLQGGAPLVLEDVEADAAEAIDVRVVDLRAEENFRRDERVLLWQEELQVEEAAFVGTVGWAGDLHQEVPGVGRGRLRVDTHDRLGSQPLGLLHDSWRNSHAFFFFNF